MASAAVGVRVKKSVYDSPEELDLVHRAKGGDEHAFRALYDTHHGRVFVTVNRMLTDEDASQWVTNMALTQVWKHLLSFKENSKFSTWITRIAINEARMYMRSQKRRQREVSLDSVLTGVAFHHIKEGDNRSSTIDPTRSQQKWLATRDLNLEGVVDRELLERAFTRVPQQFREVLRLRFWEGMSLDEIQARISVNETEPVSISAVKSRILRGRNILMEQVEKFS